MSIARHAVAESALAESAAPVIPTKTPPRRQYVAQADTTAVPEPR